MLIGIDGNEANIRERVGVNVWAFELLKQLKQKTENRKQKTMVYLRRPPLKDMPEESDLWKYRVIPPSFFWTRWRLPIDLYVHRFKGSDKGSDLSERSDPSRRPDIFLSLSHYAPKFAPMPRIISIMDLSFLHFPEAFKPWVSWQLTHWTAESVRNAAHILTISEFTKREIVRVYGYPEERITVVYPGVSEKIQEFQRKAESGKRKEIASIKKKYRVEKYLFFVGTLQPKKNLPRLLEAFQIIHNDFPDIQLVIAGKVWEQFSSSEQKAVSSKRIRYLGFVPDRDLPPLISGAQCLVLPSLYEGFGIPVLEAMALGTPVAASNTTSIPEVLGQTGVLFDPNNVSDIARGIREVLSWSPAQRQEQIKKGMIRAEKFSWEESAKKVLDAISSFA